MTRILKTPKAEADLDDIWLFIARDSITNADGFLDKLLETCSLLASHPLIGSDKNYLANKLRSFPVDKYCIFYFPLEDGIEIVRVLHSARDIQNLLN